MEIQDKMDYLIFHLALRNLDNSIRIAFERKWSSQTMKTFQSLIQFVDEACKTQKLMAPTQTKSLHHCYCRRKKNILHQGSLKLI